MVGPASGISSQNCSLIFIFELPILSFRWSVATVSFGATGGSFRWFRALGSCRSFDERIAEVAAPLPWMRVAASYINFFRLVARRTATFRGPEKLLRSRRNDMFARRQAEPFRQNAPIGRPGDPRRLASGTAT